MHADLVCSPTEQIARYRAVHGRFYGPTKKQFVKAESAQVCVHRLTRLLNITPNAMTLVGTASDSRFMTGRDFVRRIIRIVAEQHQVSIEHILSPRRAKNVVIARHFAIYLAVKHTKFSLPVIGRLFADRDHSTISYVRDKIIKERASDPKVDALLSSLEAEILKERPAMW